MGLELRAQFEMNSAPAEPPPVLEYEIVPDGLAEFDLELDRVEPPLSRVEPLVSIVPIPVPIPAAKPALVARDSNGSAAPASIPAAPAAGYVLDGRDSESVHLSLPQGNVLRIGLAIAAWALLLAGGGYWLARVWNQPATASTALALAGMPAGDDLRARAIARAAMSAVPLRLQPDAPRIEPTTPVGSPNGSARAAVDEVLESYRRSYNTLDAASVAAVWPGADATALAQAFSTLRYQNLSFERCDVRLTGADRALASCEGSISAVSKVGDTAAVQRRGGSWTIALQRVADRWLIASVEDRRGH
jgi:hypothetical protein